MKLNSILIASTLGLLVILPVQAAETTGAKQGATFAASTAAGAILGGPLGMLAGALGGAWFAEQIEDAASLESTRAELETLRVDAEHLQTDLERSRDQLAEAQTRDSSFAITALAMEMMFTTGSSELTESGRQRLSRLAALLVENPALDVQLDGFADPRGHDDYNLELSRQRVESVAKLLLAEGVEAARMVATGHGSRVAARVDGDQDAYALERVVRIQLSPRSDEAYAQSH